jgi:hypothetical protein
MVKPRDRPMERKKVMIEKYAKRQDTVEAGQSTINNRSESVLGEFDSCMSHFLFLVVFVSLIQVSNAVID